MQSGDDYILKKMNNLECSELEFRSVELELSLSSLIGLDPADSNRILVE